MATASRGLSRSPSPDVVAPAADPGAPTAATSAAISHASESARPSGRIGARPAGRLETALSPAPARAMPSVRPASSQPEAAASSAARVTQPSPAACLGTADQELAAYLLVRGLVGRPVSPPTTALLQRANETKKNVLSTLRYGRANVLTDLAATRNQGFHRLLAQRLVSGSASGLGERVAVTAARDAAVTAHLGSGNCGEFANVALHFHAGRLRDGEVVVTQKASDRDHSWVMLQGEPKPDGAPRHAIIDVLGGGPGDGAGGQRLRDHGIFAADR